MYMIIFALTFVFLIVVQIVIDRWNYRQIGKCEMEIRGGVEKMDLMTHFFRASLCVIIAIYCMYRNGNEFSLNILIFTLILAGLTSKIFFPVITISCFSDECGIYENGVVTLCGTKNYKTMASFSVHERENAVLQGNQMMFVFQSKLPYVSRPAYLYVNRRKYNQVERLLSKKFHISNVER